MSVLQTEATPRESDKRYEECGRRYFEAVDEHNGAPRILIAEPCKDLAKAYRTIFASRGFHVDIAHDSPHCLELMGVCSPDVLILERDLPLGGSDRVVAGMRANPRFTRIAVVLTVHKTPTEGLTSLVDPPIVACFQKPFRLPHLLDTIASEIPESRQS